MSFGAGLVSIGVVEDLDVAPARFVVDILQRLHLRGGLPFEFPRLDLELAAAGLVLFVVQRADLALCIPIEFLRLYSDAAAGRLVLDIVQGADFGFAVLQVGRLGQPDGRLDGWKLLVGRVGTIVGGG